MADSGRDVEALVSAEGLTKNFNGFKAVDDISFEVRKGECFGLLGPNGAGKTTTDRMIYGFSPVSSGKLTIFGMDALQRGREVKERIGVCQQENNLDPDLTALKNLEVFGRYFNMNATFRRERVRELLKFIKLEHKAGAKIPELSGGMMRRLLIARALINDPHLIILDEPTTGLDPQSRRATWDLLTGLKGEGKGILLTTHYMEEAAQLCDRLVIMDHGRILVEGKPARLIEEIIGSHVLEVVEAPEELLQIAERKSCSAEKVMGRTIFYGRHVRELFSEIGPRCQEGCSLRMATLEDVFLKLTGRELRE